MSHCVYIFTLREAIASPSIGNTLYSVGGHHVGHRPTF